MRIRRPALAAVVATIIASVFPLASALAADNEYTPLQKQRKFAEVEKLASQRLAADPANADALVAKAGAILALGEEKRLEEALKLAEACIAAHPQSSACHNALGEVLGSKAQGDGMLSAMRYAGRIRDSFAKAVELDPKNWQARINLQSYYQAAPSIVGGGKDKVAALIAETQKVNPEAARVLQARQGFADDKVDQAEAHLLALNPGNDDYLQRMQRELLYSLGASHVRGKRLGEAERILKELAKRYPESDLVPLGQGSLLHEQGKPAEAIPFYEKALAIDPRPGTYLRLAQALQAVNEKGKAAQAYEKALGQKVGLSKKQRSEAEEQLKVVRS